MWFKYLTEKASAGLPHLGLAVTYKQATVHVLNSMRWNKDHCYGLKWAKIHQNTHFGPIFISTLRETLKCGLIMPIDLLSMDMLYATKRNLAIVLAPTTVPPKGVCHPNFMKRGAIIFNLSLNLVGDICGQLCRASC